MTPPPRTVSTARLRGQAAVLIRGSGGDGFRFRRRRQLRCRLGVAAFLARADPFRALALGGLDREYRPAAGRAGLRQRQVPHRVLAVGITRAGVEDLAVARLALQEGGLLAL